MLGQLESKGYNVHPWPLQAEGRVKKFCWLRDVGKEKGLLLQRRQPSGRCFIVVGDKAPFDLME
jgi:hypothetical protein